MPHHRVCQNRTSGGKGNLGMFIERDPQICAAGIPSAQADQNVADALQHYLMQEEVDALISDAIIPPSPPPPLPRLRYPPKCDQRNTGTNSELAALVNPPEQSKFALITEDIKNTVYKSYWKNRLGHVPDPTPMLPEGFDIEGTTFGKSTKSPITLYEVVMPKDPLPGQTPLSKLHGVQTCRNYCKPAFNPDFTYGYRANADNRGIKVKCALTDEKALQGTADRCYINFIQADYNESKRPALGQALAPNNNISCVPEGYTFGYLKPLDNLPECLSFCELNPGQKLFRKYVAHLNSLRKVMSTRYLPTFFRTFHNTLKYYDTCKTGWLPKEIVYEQCATKYIRFDPKMIEPLLCMWNAFDGSHIEYKTFIHILNFKQPLPTLAKVPDMSPDCYDYRTTYSEMVKPGKEVDQRLRAGIPSGRYFDLDFPVTPTGYCKANKVALSHESDINSCIKPSIFTLVHINHRDMYAKREPDIVRRVFAAAGDVLTDEQFNAVWEDAKKYHSEGWVCYETFRKALDKFQESSKNTEVDN